MPKSGANQPDPDSPSRTIYILSVVNSKRRSCQRIDGSVGGRESEDEWQDYGFKKTVVPVRLARQGAEKLISRSQAKRLLARVDRFTTVLFDFRDVDTAGRAFIDEIFRVFANAHPNISLHSINTNRELKRMIATARSNRE